MKITLSEDSASVLEKVPTLKKWSVSPPMTRGARAAAQKASEAAGAAAAAAEAPKNKGKKTKLKTLKMHVKHPKEKKDKKSKPVIPIGDHTADSIRRNSKGKAAVVDLMTAIIEADEKTFPASPAFHVTEGFCRMDFEGAKDITRAMVIENAPKAFESMCPV